MRADGVGGGRSGFSAATAGRAPLAAAGSVSAARNGGPWTRAFTRSRDARLDLDLRRAAERGASFSAPLSLLSFSLCDASSFACAPSPSRLPLGALGCAKSAAVDLLSPRRLYLFRFLSSALCLMMLVLVLL